MNLDAGYFMDSYNSEIQALKHRLDLYKEVLSFQKQQEAEQNRSVRVF